MKKNINIPSPKWDSDLVQNVLDLEKLRNRKIEGDVPEFIFFQLKKILQIIETVGSSRIEGNHTTLSEYTDKLVNNNSQIQSEESFLEIENLNKAFSFISKNIKNFKTDEAFLSELHKIITKDLNKEGSKNLGKIRSQDVSIKGSKHKPVSFLQVHDYYQEFLKFINQEHKPQNQILMVAIAHHRFTYIHPFDNGNGRLGRLLNYALLLKTGFDSANIINHSQIFYSNRNKYYETLKKADSLKDSDILEWANYFILGLKNEMEKNYSLARKKNVIKNILQPALTDALDNSYITKKNFNILNLIIDQKEMCIKAEILSEIGITKSLEKSRAIKNLRDKKMIKPTKKNGRIYTLCFDNNILLRCVINSFRQSGYIDSFLENNT